MENSGDAVCENQAVKEHTLSICSSASQHPVHRSKEPGDQEAESVCSVNSECLGGHVRKPAPAPPSAWPERVPQGP